MRALLQRVSRGSVVVEGRTTGSIDDGLVVLAAVKADDTVEDCRWLAAKIADLRIFPDDTGKMNRSVQEAGGAVLLISQFTLYGDVRKGRRPSFTESARPEEAVPMLELLRDEIRALDVRVEEGEFGAHMEVELLNDGPVTLMLDSATRRGAQNGRRESAISGRFRILAKDSPLRDVPLVLASASPRRRDLLRDLGAPFSVHPADVEETFDEKDDPVVVARALAVRKAEAVTKIFPDRLILAADTLVTCGDRTYGKPADADDAVRILRALAGRVHEVVTGLCVARGDRDLYLTESVTTRVRFRAIEDAEIHRYVDTGEPFGKAGAYAIQGLGALLVAGIEGDYTNIVGLPLGLTVDLLEKALTTEEAS